METIIYFIIRLLVAIYLLCRLWLVLRWREQGVWVRLFGPAVRKDSGIPARGTFPEEEVVGRTQTVYLEAPAEGPATTDSHGDEEAGAGGSKEEPVTDASAGNGTKSRDADGEAGNTEMPSDTTGRAEPVPVRSEPLEKSDYLGPEPEIASDDVEAHLLPPEERELQEEERYEPLPGVDPAPETEFSTGMTFEQMANAVGVVTAAVDDEEKVLEAAQTIYNLRHTDLFRLLTTEAGNAGMVERLLAEYLDGEGNPLPQRRKTTVQERSFDWNKYL